MSSENITHLKLVLVGEPAIGKSALCREWSPKFAPEDGYHIYHSNNQIYTRLSDIKTPPFAQNEPPVTGVSAQASLFIMILQPRQEGDHVKLTPFTMMNTDIVGLCYNSLDAKTLEDAVNKWLPFIKYYLPSTPIVLIGHSRVAATGVPTKENIPTSPELVRKAIRQIEAVDSVQWSHNGHKDGDNLVTPEHVSTVLAWYGYHYALHSSRSSSRHCIVV
ncbi:hypothetical protein M408DRAFT_328405 [Serendipita vermifera MAFF 305830]|uniref:P-loop containing nucleoside triphosphate hydrolase protein n=1 Tax=Serendipita vermifera MAFF 305830 TaxID=933852 RepID=A0A0C2WUT6_SERVB|nr:hypothetical protein M408DRAFT_328405 [Serendipita vermifera MAFF 305830]